MSVGCQVVLGKRRYNSERADCGKITVLQEKHVSRGDIKTQPACSLGVLIPQTVKGQVEEAAIVGSPREGRESGMGWARG